jgi:hypothetical protein
MKTKIIAIGVLLCITAGCGIFNSKKFNPHLDGAYWFHYHRDHPAPDSLCGHAGCFTQEWYTDFIYVDYPYFLACHVNYNLPLGKEKVKVAHKKGNIYKIIKINGKKVNKGNITYKITKSSKHYKEGTAYYLTFTKIKNGKEHYSIRFNKSKDSDSEESQENTCEAPDTTGIFPSFSHTKIIEN